MTLCPHCGQPIQRRRVERIVSAKRERRRQQIEKRNAEIVRLALTGKSPKMIEGILNVTTSVIAPILSAARAAGTPVPRFPSGGAALNHPMADRKPTPITPAHPIVRMAAPETVPSAEPARPYEARLRDLAGKGVALTGIAAMLGRPYREIISDMERLGLSRVKT